MSTKKQKISLIFLTLFLSFLVLSFSANDSLDNFLESLTPFVRAGNMYVPHQSMGTWLWIILLSILPNFFTFLNSIIFSSIAYIFLLIYMILKTNKKSIKTVSIIFVCLIFVFNGLSLIFGLLIRYSFTVLPSLQLIPDSAFIIGAIAQFEITVKVFMFFDLLYISNNIIIIINLIILFVLFLMNVLTSSVKKAFKIILIVSLSLILVLGTSTYILDNINKIMQYLYSFGFPYFRGILESLTICSYTLLRMLYIFIRDLLIFGVIIYIFINTLVTYKGKAKLLSIIYLLPFILCCFAYIYKHFILISSIFMMIIAPLF